jgi:hypothetical protein
MTASACRTISLALIPLILAAWGAGMPAADPRSPVDDAQAPRVAVTAAVAGDHVVLAATAADNVGVACVNFLVDGHLVPGAVVRSRAGGSWSLAVPLASLSGGTHRFAAVALDAADNGAQSTTSLTLDAPGVAAAKAQAGAASLHDAFLRVPDEARGPRSRPGARDL